MRQFTPWAEALGGFLEYHGITGFLSNTDTVRDIDEDEATWAAFLAQWRTLFGNEWRTSNQVRLSADISPGGTDRWEGLYPTNQRGYPLGHIALGKRLIGQIGHHRGAYALRSDRDTHTKNHLWRVEERPSELPPE
jgi:hypothetical protein